jgi:sugar fermentation stimulation protein A
MPGAMTPTAPLFVPHRLAGPYLPGRLLRRENRFLGIVALESGGAPVEAHIADRGRLTDILFPGAEVYLAPARAQARSAAEGRRTAYSLVCARTPALSGERGGGPLCCLDPAFANQLVRALLVAGALPALPPFSGLQAEVRVGASRFDFALTLGGGGRLLLEVKNAAAAQGRAALFPDAPSVRAARHCHELAACAAAGEAAAVVLVAQRADVAEIRPHPVDPTFAEALAAARRAGVLVLGAAFAVDLRGFTYAGERPVLI